MAFPLSTMTLRVFSTLVCTSLVACGGGSTGANTDSVTATAGVSGGAVAATPAVTTPAVTTPIVTTPEAATPAVTTPAVTTPVATTPTTTTPTVTDAVAYGNYLRPYAANSLWNSRPVDPVFGTFVIPKSSYFPSIASGAYSTGVFLAASTDQPATVIGRTSTDTVTVGVADPDSGGSHLVTIPRWPAGVLPATGTDGHADIVDPVTNTIHSFWQLKQTNGKWTAALYSWSKLDGTGWGDPAHYYQGARAVGIPASAGLIRKHEIKDGLPAYKHALAMSLTFNALANGVSSPAYVFPATSADGTASANTGSIQQGALLMLPPTFDSSGIVNADLKKVVETLKLYGAYIVDRNDGTPFVIYVENDSGFNLMPNGWDNTIASQLDQIRAALRQVVSAPAYIDANGNSSTEAIKAQQNMNILSMRGPWVKQSGTAAAAYDTATQSLVFEAATAKATHFNANNTGMTPVKWAVPAGGTYVKFTVIATGGATMRMQVGGGGSATIDTGALADGQSVRILWPTSARFTLVAYSGTNGVSSVRAEVVPSP